MVCRITILPEKWNLGNFGQCCPTVFPKILDRVWGRLEAFEFLLICKYLNLRLLYLMLNYRMFIPVCFFWSLCATGYGTFVEGGATDAGSQDNPFTEGVQLFAVGAGGLAPVKSSRSFAVGLESCTEFAVENYGLHNHCHVGEIEMPFDVFPQTDEDIVGVIAVAEDCAYAVPVKRTCFGIEYEGGIFTEVKVEFVDSTFSEGGYIYRCTLYNQLMNSELAS